MKKNMTGLEALTEIIKKHTVSNNDAEDKELEDLCKVVYGELEINEILKRHIVYEKLGGDEFINTYGYLKDKETGTPLYCFTKQQEGTKGDFNTIREWLGGVKFLYGWEYLASLGDLPKEIRRKEIMSWLFISKKAPVDLITTYFLVTFNHYFDFSHFKFAKTFYELCKELPTPTIYNYEKILDCRIPIDEANESLETIIRRIKK